MKLVTHVTLFFIIVYNANAQQYGWSVIYKPPTAAATVIDFYDSTHGWVDTREGIRRTTDGGLTWAEPNKTIVSRNFNFVNAKDGWIVGYDGIRGHIYNSVDSGKTIKLLYRKDYQLLEIGKGLTPTKFIAAGINNYNIPLADTAVIVRTTDGGTTFKEEAFLDSPFVYFQNLDFTDSLHGWIYGEYDSTGISPYVNKCTFLKTSDGGKSWQRYDVKNRNIQKFETVTFLDTLIGWGWYYGQMFKTYDGAKNWNKIWPSDRQQTDLSLSKISFIDSLNGWCCGGTFVNGGIGEIVYKTIDGGKNWIEESRGISTYAYDIKMLSKTLGYAAADEVVLKYGAITEAGMPLHKTPSGYILKDNYPNPFNPSTTIEYELPERTRVELKVFDLLGKEIAILVSEEQSAGIYSKGFDAKGLPSGIYFYKITTKNFEMAKQMLLLK